MVSQLMIRSRWMLLLFLGIALGCGEPDPGATVIDDGQGDIGVETDAGVNGKEGDGDTNDDTGDVDLTEPGTPVDGEGDNCPLISNPDQRDRSRDGVGDACAHYPYFHDSSNPEFIDVIVEDEGPSNAGFFDARTHWNLDLPFILEGGVSSPGELDYYAFEIDEPTTVLFHVEAMTPSMWPTMIVMGDESSNRGYQSVVITPNRGESDVRDIHFPVPGLYIVVISDFNNLTGGSPSGGDGGYEYRLSLSTPPLPEAESVSLPAPRKIVPYDEREAAVFSIDVSGEDTLKVEVSGAPRNQNAMLMPSIQFLDAETGETLAFTLEDQANADTLRSQLTMKIGDELETVLVVVEAHTSLGENDLVIDIETYEKSDHLASFVDPRQSRVHNLLWMRLESGIRSMIGAPRPIDDTTLEADEDFFLYLANPGDFLKISAEPTEGSRIAPELSVGEFFSDTFFSAWHRGFGATNAGDSAELSALITRDNRGGAVVQVRHAGNISTTLPVGGPQYSYDLRVESLDIHEQAEQFDVFPASVPIVLAAGEQGLYDFPFQAGYRYDIDYEGASGRPVQLIDTDTWEVIESTTNSHSFVHRSGRDLIIGIRDNSGHPIDAASDITLDISEGSGPRDVDTPVVVEDRLDDDTPVEVFRFSATAGEFLEARVASMTGATTELEIIGESILQLETADPRMAAVYVEEDTELLAVVSRTTSINLDYMLGIHSIDSVEVTTPHEVFDAFDAEMKGYWMKVAVEQHSPYAINVMGESAQGQPVGVGVYDVETLQRVTESADGFAIFDSGARDEVYVSIADPGGPISPSTDYGLSVTKIETIPYVGEENIDIVDGIRPVFLSFDNDGGGLSKMEVVGDSQNQASARIGNSSFQAIDGQEIDQSLTAIARSSHRELTGIVVPVAGDGNSWTATVEITNIGPDEAYELGANEAVAGDSIVIDEWPAVYRGLLNSDTSTRSFAADMEEGDSLWIVTMPGPGTGATDLFMWLDILWPTGGFMSSDFGSGEGNFPMLSAVELPEDNQWQIELINAGGGDGSFVIYFLRR